MNGIAGSEPTHAEKIEYPPLGQGDGSLGNVRDIHFIVYPRITHAIILEAYENFALFLQTAYTIEMLLAGFNVQPRIGVNQSLI